MIKPLSALILVLQFILPISAEAQKPSIVFNTIPGKSSIRGLSVVDDSVVWMSGSLGTVCRSIDGAKTFECFTVPGHDSSDFRSIYAFDEMTALICKIGSPGKILKTIDGGKTWREVYNNDHEATFIDGIDFWNAKEGICFGDPINGNILLITTNDGGTNWEQMPAQSRPVLVEGESAFAASGTSIRCFDSTKVMIATGGEISRLLISNNKGNTWNSKLLPMAHGTLSSGTFSFDFFDNNRGVAVGGDYKADTLAIDHIYITRDGGTSWLNPPEPTRGYRECVEYLSASQLIAVGPTGMDISHDGGMTWNAISDEKKFHVVRKARNGKLVVIAGGGEKIGVLDYKTD